MKKTKLQVKDEKSGKWQDVITYNIEEHEAWTNTGCYRIALNEFRLVDESEECEYCDPNCKKGHWCINCGLGLKPKQIEKLRYYSTTSSGSSTGQIISTVNQIIDYLNKSML